MRFISLLTFLFSLQALALTNSEFRTARNNGLYFSLIPTLKTKIVSLSLTRSDVEAITEITERFGGEQFEQLSSSYLRKIDSGATTYLAAKQMFKDSKYGQALKLVKKSLSSKDSLNPYKYLLAGSASSLLRKNKDAKEYFRKCIETSRANRGSSDDQQIFNKEIGYAYDSCLVGLARIEFQEKNFVVANELYGRLDKSSLIWPEILFEEAWNSFYQNDFNRTLGKLITYNSPFIAHVFNPEVEILNAMTYLELCRYDDAKKTINEFYKKYKKDAEILGYFNKRYKNKPSKLGSILVNFDRSPVETNKLIKKLLKAINRDLAFMRMDNNLQKIKEELRLVKNVTDRRMKKKLAANLKRAYLDQIKIIGAYGQRILKRQENMLNKSMVGMSYINLEIIKKLKRKFFAGDESSGQVGNIKNLKRSSSQYLWDFNGEFWADELGDYVFALKSSCS